MEKFVTDNNLEIQQRAGEMMKLLSNDICEELLSPIEVQDDDENQNPIIQQSVEPQKSTNNNVDDILLFALDGDSSNNNYSVPQQKTNDNLIDSLLSDTISNNQALVQENSSQIKCPPGTRQIFEKSDFILFGQTKANPNDPSQFAVNLIFYGKGTNHLSDFIVIGQFRYSIIFFKAEYSFKMLLIIKLFCGIKPLLWLYLLT